MRRASILAAHAVAVLGLAASSQMMTENRAPGEPDLFEGDPNAEPTNRQQRRARERAEAKRRRKQ